MDKNKLSVFSNLFYQFRDINLGIIIIGTYFIFEFGSVQGLYPIVSELKLPYILAVLSIGYALFLVFTDDYVKKAINKYYISFLIYTIIYTIISTKLDIVKYDLLKLFCVFLSHYIIIISCIRKPSQFILLINIWLISIMFSCYHGIMQGGLVWGNRWLKDENHLSLIAATAVPFAFIFFRVARKRIFKLFYSICLMLYVAANFAAASRGGALALFSSLLLCWMLLDKKFRTLLIVVFIIICVAIFSPEHRTGLKFFNELETLQQGINEETASDRIYLWKIALKMFYDHPVFGMGPMNYPFYFKAYEKGVVYYSDFRVAHSTPIQWLAETGILGSIFLILLQISMYRNWRVGLFYKKYNESKENDNDFKLYKNINHACMISQVAFWVAACFLSLLPYPFYWVLIPFSDSWKNIFVDHIQSQAAEEY